MSNISGSSSVVHQSPAARLVHQLGDAEQGVDDFRVALVMYAWGNTRSGMDQFQDLSSHCCHGL